MVKYVNLTPHDITIVDHDGNQIARFPAESTDIGDSARVDFRRRKIGDIGGIPITVRTYSGISNLPPPEPGTIYIVSKLAAIRAQRDDVVAPGTMIRNDGKVIGCLGFHQIIWQQPQTGERTVAGVRRALEAQGDLL